MRDQRKSAAVEGAKGMQSYDIIGDIHGHADELNALLETLGYRNGKGAHSHPEAGRSFSSATTLTGGRRSGRFWRSCGRWSMPGRRWQSSEITR